jgi:hypothetical protein
MQLRERIARLEQLVIAARANERARRAREPAANEAEDILS